MKIAKLVGREIFDSRGYPTIESMLFLEDGQYVTASVPSGISRGEFEAKELRDGGSRLMGLGVSKAIYNLEQIIAPELVGQEPSLVDMDIKMLELDGTTDRGKLGANAILAASMAVLKAQAVVHEVELYELIAHLCDLELVRLPYPMLNVLNGGLHADNKLRIQEFMIVPIDFSSFRAAMEGAVTVFFELKALLSKKGLSVAVGDEGGFAPDVKDEYEALDFLVEAIEKAKKKTQGKFVIALDIAASQFYDKKKKRYTWNKKLRKSENMIALYEKLVEQYPIYSIEDGLSEHDQEGWAAMMEALGEKIQIVGDDIFATSPERIWHGIEHSLANAVIIKPNQIGTVTETLQAIKLAKENDWNVIISHRSGETNDPFIADLAVGTSSGYIKAGGCSRGERLAKYNHLLSIEDMLVLSLLES